MDASKIIDRIHARKVKEAEAALKADSKPMHRDDIIAAFRDGKEGVDYIVPDDTPEQFRYGISSVIFPRERDGFAHADDLAAATRKLDAERDNLLKNLKAKDIEDRIDAFEELDPLKPQMAHSSDTATAQPIAGGSKT